MTHSHPQPHGNPPGRPLGAPTADTKFHSRENRPSFRDIVAGSSRWFPTVKCLFEELEEESMEAEMSLMTQHKVQFTKANLQALRAPWAKTLMGKVLGTTIRYEILTQGIPALWRPLGKLEIIDLGKDVFLFRFERQNDIKKVLFRGPWFLFGHYLMLTK